MHRNLFCAHKKFAVRRGNMRYVKERAPNEKETTTIDSVGWVAWL